MMTQNSEGRQSPGPGIYCDQSRLLLEAFGEAVQGLLILHEQQFLAIVEGDMECHRFDLLIHMANEKKQQAKYAYMHHVETHGGSSINDGTH